MPTGPRGPRASEGIRSRTIFWPELGQIVRLPTVEEDPNRRDNGMMELSENAAAALENLRVSQGVPEDQGTRITAEQAQEGNLALRLEFVEEIPETDQVIEQAGTEVHLDEKVVEPLEDAVMDVQDTEEGLAFVFRGQTA